MKLGNTFKEVRKSLDPKANNNKEMDTGKKTIKRRNAPHLRGGSNTGSLRTPKNTPNINGVERGWSAVKSLPNRKYDIATLMAIGKNGGTDSIIAKFSYQSVENNLVRRNTSSGDRVLTEKRTSHIRGASRGSIGNEDEHSSAQESNLKHPSRQPRNAPQGRLAQANAGFARFLKEHASPKHQRVTAGGRIVPMDSVLPAPEFNLPGNTQQEDKNTTRKTSTVGLSSDSSSFGCFSNETRSSTQPELRSDAQSKSGQGQASSAETSGYVQTSSAPNMANSNAQHQVPPFVQISQGQMNMIPVSLLQGHMPSGTTLVGSTQTTPISPNYTTGLPTTSTFNGNSEQGFPSDQPQNQQFLTPQYLPIFAQQPIQGMFSPQVGGITGMFQPVPSLHQMHVSPSMYQVTNVGGAPQGMPQVQMMNAAHTIPNFQQNPALNTVLSEVSREYDSLNEQLSNVDRYLALHTWDIDPATKRALVDQRKELVIKIDSTRTNKELLESAMKSSKTGVPTRSQNDTGQYFPITQSQAQGDDGAPATKFQTAFWNQNATLHHASQGYVPDFVTNTPTPTNAYSSSAFAPSVPVQSPMPAQQQYEPAWTEYEAHQSFDNSAYGNIGVENWAQPPNSIGRSFNQDRHRTSIASVPANAVETDDWSTPNKPAPPEISRMYSKIEEAANRGANIEKILEDLALVTARLNEARYDREIIERSGVKPQQSHFDYRSEDPLQVRPSSENQTEGQVLTQSYGPPQTSTHRSATGKRGNRGIPIINPQDTFRNGPEDVGDDDDNDGGSSYSDESTYSWATIEVGDKHWLARQKLKADNPQTPGDVSSKKHRDKGSAIRERLVLMPIAQRHIANIGGRDGDPSGNIVKTVKPKTSGDSKTASMRQTTEWVESGGSRGGEQYVHDQSPGQYREPQRQDLDARAKGSPEKVRASSKHTHRRSDIFALGPWARSSESSQKSGTSTSFQDVNAHAFLPPFDGAGDTRQNDSGAADTTTPRKDDRNHEASKGRAGEAPQRWYMKPHREAPSPAEVHKFFRSIEEEERIMIEKYRGRHPV
ncbi:hypothetical protein FQN54_006196 [Arachnomyces sp. PD_36]|nr:hypothetical protein FQN54_006196 [Arachnomyces sp. PD_36]